VRHARVAIAFEHVDLLCHAAFASGNPRNNAIAGPEPTSEIPNFTPSTDNVSNGCSGKARAPSWRKVAKILQLRYNFSNYPDDVEPTVVRRNGSRKG
jgi:hypothetical protein